MTNLFEQNLDISYKTEVFRNIVKEIKGLEKDEDKIKFYVREINNDNNNKFIMEHYAYLKKHFKLPHHSRIPKKLTSQTLLAIFKECNFNYSKTTKSYKMKDLKTTSGFYVVCV